MYDLIQGCENAFKCLQRLDANLSARENRTADIYENLYSFLGYSAAVSLILWPSPRGKREVIAQSAKRGASLRSSLGVKDSNILSERGLRDHFVHMDERLDAWWESSQNRNIVRRMVAPRNAIAGISVSDVFEHYIPTEGVLIFRGDEYDIRAYVRGLQDIHERARTRLRELERPSATS